MQFSDPSIKFFGEDPDTLLPDSAKLDAEQFLTSFDEAMAGVGCRTAIAGVSFVYFRATRDAEWRQSIAEVHKNVDKYKDETLTEEAKAGATAKNGEQGLGRGVVTTVNVTSKSHVFSVLSELVKVTTDRKFLRDQLVSLFFPSRDATGIDLGGLFFNLARHPHVWTTVREEVMISLGPEQPLTFENLKSMKYLQSVLSESLRLLAPALMGAGMCVTDTVLPRAGDANGDSPLFIQAGTKVDMYFGVMQRDADGESSS
ncbi:MAG: hypothetical protein ASARMPRED_005211 [Alectoria sarmentosa]|nr:MAG: hypothetical protein ASARMPRED_005211 [Alectoria sarmentosa]